MSVNRLPPVVRIRAVHLPEGGPRVPKSLTIEYSYHSNASKWYQLEVTRCTSLLCYRERRTTSAIKSPLRHRRPRRTDAPHLSSFDQGRLPQMCSFRAQRLAKLAG